MEGYRGDIQIFRALAVSVVLFFHLGISGFDTGFLGVDIFFVISGYLMQRLHRDDHSAAHFYNRRARRLLPAYFATVIATLTAAYFITLPAEFSQTAEQALFASAFASNIGFWFQNSYFAKDTFNPLLHLWSLGAEIQFYLLFPLIAWMCRGRRWLLVAIIIGSLALCLALVMISPKTAFFMMPARLWQFSLGMFAATLSTRPNSRIGIAAFAGMILIPLIPLNADAQSIIAGHPGLAAIAVSCCTAMALANGLPDRLVASGFGRAAQRLGDISYSLYLAHWPVLVLWHYAPFSGTRTTFTSAVDLVVSTGLIALFTCILYHFFERKGPRLYSVRRSAAAAVTIAVCALFIVPMQARRFPVEQQLIFAAAQDRATYRCGKVFRIVAPRASLCPIGEGEVPLLLIGDSHSDSIKQSFAQMATKNGFATYFAVPNDPLIQRRYSASWLLRQARSVGARKVYLHFSPKNLKPAIVIEAANTLAQAGIVVSVIAPVPVYKRSVPASLHDHVTQGVPLPDQSFTSYREQNGGKLAAISRAGITVVEVAPTLCAPQCALRDPAGHPTYFDDGHLTLSGARMLEPVFSAALSRHDSPDRSNP